MKGYFVPDPHLQKAKGFDALDNFYTSNPVVFSSINDMTSSLFNLHRKDHFQIVSQYPEWRDYFSELFVKNPPKELYGFQIYDLANFLELVLKSLFVFGKAFFQIGYSKGQNDLTKDKWGIQMIGWLPVETMNAKYSKDKIKGFVQEYSSNDKVKDPPKVEFNPEEILFFEWAFDKKDKKGVSPLKALLPQDRKYIKFLELGAQKAHAMANPQDHSRNVERARYASLEKAKSASEISEAIIEASIGMALNSPMTEYYAVYQFAKSRQRIASIRQYLMDQLNVQLVGVLSRKNGLTEPAYIRLVGYLSSSEIEQLFRKFQEGQVSEKEILTTLQNDMMGSIDG